MSDTVPIPKFFVSHANTRIVWFGRSATITQESTTKTTTQSENSSVFDAQNGLKRDSSGGYELSTNGDSDVASMSWNKDTESPAGVLSLLLFPRRDYLNLISPEDIFVVYGKADKKSQEVLVSVVSVDSVFESRSVTGTGATVTRYNVQARDMGKILMETRLIFDAAFGGLVMQQFFSQFVNAFVKGQAQGGPSVVVQTMLAIFFSLSQNFVTKSVGQVVDDTPPDPTSNPSTTPLQMWRFPGRTDISLFSIIDTSSHVQVPMVGALIADASLLQSASNLWALCDMYANRLVNEMFIDVRDLSPGFNTATNRMAYFAQQYLSQFGTTGQDQIGDANALAASMDVDVSTRASNDFDIELDPNESTRPSTSVALVHRQLPYDTQTFYALPTSIVYETEVFANELGRSSRDVHNMFRIRFPGIIEGLQQDLQFGVAINRDSISKHGLRLFEGESIYVWTNATEDGGAFAQSSVPTFDFYQNLITTWYAFNEYMYSGSLTMRFRPDIRVGTRLTFVTTAPNGTVSVYDFYVQRVQHTYSPNAGQSRTSLDLVRGIERDGLALSPFRESHLFWSDKGGDLDPNPYEVVISEDVLGVAAGGEAVNSAFNLAPELE